MRVADSTYGADRFAYSVPAVAIVLFHLATAPGYGIFRDELYYLACTEHLAWGYVDHPPLSIAILAVARRVFGDSLYAIRLVPALAAGGVAVLAASTARALGGAAFAQRTAAIGAAAAPLAMGISGFYSMNALDLVFWTAAFRVVAAILAGGDPRLWLVFGAITGLGLENKISVLFLGFGVAAGIVAARRWEILRTRWIWIAGAAALFLFLPHLVWQAANGWPTLEFMANARRYKMTGADPAGFLRDTFVNGGPLVLPFWVGGLGWLIARPEAVAWRALGYAWIAIAAVLVVTGAKPYYLAPALPLAFAAGGVAWERWTARRGRTPLRWIIATLLIADAVVTAPLAKPLLPVERFVAYSRALGIAPHSGERHALGRLPQHFADMHGWKELAETVARVRDRLPEADRARVCVAGQNYGEAGAIDYFGPALGLPKAVSGHNAYWQWGPGHCGVDQVWIVIGDRREVLEGIFESVEKADTFDCDLCMPYEDDNPIWICRGLRGSVEELWPRAKHFI